jgi:hypothetical protein
MRWAIVVAMLWAPAVRADDPPPDEAAPAEAAPVELAPVDLAPAQPAATGGLIARLRDDDAGPLLRFDPIVSTPVGRSLLATVERREAEFGLGHGNRARFTAEHWNDAGTHARGMTAGLELSHDFGFARLIVHGGMNQVGARYGSGTSLSAGAALVTMRRLSRWTTIWLSLGLEFETWLDQPRSSRGAMLRFGTTFR